MIEFSKTLAEHIAHIDAVLTALREAVITPKLRKCKFFTHRIRYMGHIIRPVALEAEETATASLKALRHPKTPGDLLFFLGMFNVYREFIKGYKEIAAPQNCSQCPVFRFLGSIELRHLLKAVTSKGLRPQGNV